MRGTDLFGIVAAVLGMIAFSACDVVDSSQVSASADYATYSATYNAQGSSASFSAHFAVGGSDGTVLQLDNGSQVTVDGTEMVPQSDIFNDLYYVSDEASIAAAQFQQQHVFVFVDQNGNSFRNAFSFPSLPVVVGSQPLNGSVESGFSVAWAAQGSPDSLGAGDSITATLTRSDGSVASETGAAGSAGTVTFTPSDLQSLGPSTVTLVLCHVTSTSAIQGDSEGGWLQVSSCSAQYTVSLN